MKQGLKVFLLVFFLFSIQVWAQNDTILLKNGKKLYGKAEFKNRPEIIFHSSKDEVQTEYAFEMIERLTVVTKKSKRTYAFVKDKKEAPLKMMQIVTDGPKMTLYFYSTTGNNPGLGNNTGAIGGQYNITYFYVKKATQNTAIPISSNQPFLINFKKVASTFFNDCPDLLEKINNREFKKKHLTGITNYYNNTCK